MTTITKQAAINVVKGLGNNDPNDTDYNKGLDDAIAALNALPVDEWRDIESAPSDGAEVLVCVTYSLGADEYTTEQWVDYQYDGQWMAY